MRQLILHRPKREADVVPAEIAEAAERFQFVADADVAGHELVCAAKAELDW